MRKKLLIFLVIVGLIVAACGNKNKNVNPNSTDQSNGGKVEIEQQENDETNPSPDNAADGTDEVEGEPKVREEYVEITQAKVKELQNVQEATKDNYKVIQEIHRKYEKSSGQGLKIEKEEQKHMEQLVENAKKVEEDLEKDNQETIAFIFMETANGLNAIKGEGIIENDLAFDRVEVKFDDKVFETEVNEQSFTLNRKLVLSNDVENATIVIYQNNLVVKEVPVPVSEI